MKNGVNKTYLERGIGFTFSKISERVQDLDPSIKKEV
jgi:hypothetical protein